MKYFNQILRPIGVRNRALILASVLVFLFGEIQNARLAAEPAAQLDRGKNDDPVKEIRVLNDEILPNHAAFFGYYINLMDRRESNRRETSRELVQIFKDQTAANGARTCAANCLGELRMQDAVNDLALRISFPFSQPFRNHDINDIPDFGQFPAQHALIKIGVASVPALIQNLAQSDDAQVRKLSLEAIYRIEGDKDIVQIRLQKAAQAETDPNRRARLQVALKALGETKF